MHSVHDTAGAAVDYHYWATGVPADQRQLPPIKNPSPLSHSPWDRLPQAWYDEFSIHGAAIENTLRAQDNWHFREYGQGALLVRLTAGGNVVIALTGNNHSDLNGYYIVLDDDNHESYVVKVSRLGNNGLLRSRVSGPAVSRRREYAKVQAPLYTDPTFRFDFSRETFLWVMYKLGTIVVGEGAQMGQGRIILYMAPEPSRRPLQHGNELYHFGFAKHGNRWRGSIDIHETQVLAWRDRSSPMPLPAPPRTTTDAQEDHQEESTPAPSFLQWVAGLFS